MSLIIYLFVNCLRDFFLLIMLMMFCKSCRNWWNADELYYRVVYLWHDVCLLCIVSDESSKVENDSWGCRNIIHALVGYTKPNGPSWQLGFGPDITHTFLYRSWVGPVVSQNRMHPNEIQWASQPTWQPNKQILIKKWASGCLFVTHGKHNQTPLKGLLTRRDKHNISNQNSI